MRLIAIGLLFLGLVCGFVAKAEDRIETVRKNETLANFAYRVLGKHGYWFAIYKANKDVIKNPDLIEPGTQLRIPGRFKTAKSNVPTELPAKIIKGNSEIERSIASEPTRKSVTEKLDDNKPLANYSEMEVPEL